MGDVIINSAMIAKALSTMKKISDDMENVYVSGLLDGSGKSVVDAELTQKLNNRKESTNNVTDSDNTNLLDRIANDIKLVYETGLSDGADKYMLDLTGYSNPTYGNVSTKLKQLAITRPDVKVAQLKENTDIIKYSVFKDCENLRVIIPLYRENFCSTIDRYAFSGCKNLEILDLRHLEILYLPAFSGCESLAKIYLSKTVSIPNFMEWSSDFLQIPDSAWRTTDGADDVIYHYIGDTNGEPVIIKRITYTGTSGAFKLSYADAYYTALSVGTDDTRNVHTIDLNNVLVEKISIGLLREFTKLKELRNINAGRRFKALASYFYEESVSDTHANLNKNYLPTTLKNLTLNNIPQSFCKNANYIESVELNGDVDEDAFFSCANLRKVKFTKSTTFRTIGKRVFGNCTILNGIDVDEDDEFLATDDSKRMLFVRLVDNEEHGWKLVTYLSKRYDTEFVVPSEMKGLPVTHIGAEILTSSTHISKVILPETLVSIEQPFLKNQSYLETFESHGDAFRSLSLLYYGHRRDGSLFEDHYVILKDVFLVRQYIDESIYDRYEKVSYHLMSAIKYRRDNNSAYAGRINLSNIYIPYRTVEILAEAFSGMQFYRDRNPTDYDAFTNVMIHFPSSLNIMDTTAFLNSGDKLGWHSTSSGNTYCRTLTLHFHMTPEEFNERQLAEGVASLWGIDEDKREYCNIIINKWAGD